MILRKRFECCCRHGHDMIIVNQDPSMQFIRIHFVLIFKTYLLNYNKYVLNINNNAICLLCCYAEQRDGNIKGTYRWKCLTIIGQMNKELKSIKTIKFMLVTGAFIAFAITCYQARDSFLKGWNDVENSAIGSARYHMPIFENIVIPANDSLNIKGKDGFTYNLKTKYILSGDAYNQTFPQKKLSLLNVFQTSLILVLLVFGILLLVKLYYFIDDSSKGLIFTLDNINRIKSIGGYCILISITSLIVDIVSYHISKELFRHTELKTSYDLDFNYLLCTVGVVTIIIMYVFKKGYDLKQEQDLTV